MAGGLALIGVIGLVGCGSETVPGSPLEYASPARAMDDIECATLLADDELEAVLGVPVSFVGRFASSCYWRAGRGVVQLVLQTGATVEGWRSELRRTTRAPSTRGPMPGASREGHRSQAPAPGVG